MRALTLAAMLLAGCASRLLSPSDLGAGSSSSPDLAPLGYTRITTLIPGCEAASIARADLDGDGKDDLAVSCAGASVVILFGRGDGSYPTTALFGGNGFSSAAAEIVIADIDRDGRPDLVALQPDGVVVILNRGSGTWAPMATKFSAATTGLALADFDGDGNLDVVVGLAGKTGAIAWALGDGKGGFAAPQTITLTEKSALRVAARDFDGDGHVDFALGTSDESPHIDLFAGDGKGGFTPLTSVDIPDGANANVLAAGDLDADQLADLVVASGTLFRVVDHGGLNARLIGSTTGIRDAAIADLDGDALPDIATVTSDGVTLFLQGSNGNFLPPAGVAAIAGSLAVAVGDENGDGRNDLLVGSRNQVDVLLRRP